MSRQRRISQMSRRRVSGTSGLSRNDTSHVDPQPTPSSSPPRKAEQSSPPSNIPLPRTRLTSIISRGFDNLAQSAPSPLAQIFQPLVVNDGPSADLMDPHHQQQLADNFLSDDGGSPLISYGLASRRRLLSMNRQAANATPPTAAANLPSSSSSPAVGNGMRGFPLSGDSSGRLGPTALPVSQSPDERMSEESPQPDETADQIEDSGPGVVVIQRLDRIEERQRRMEDLLTQLISKLDK